MSALISDELRKMFDLLQSGAEIRRVRTRGESMKYTVNGVDVDDHTAIDDLWFCGGFKDKIVKLGFGQVVEQLYDPTPQIPLECRIFDGLLADVDYDLSQLNKELTNVIDAFREYPVTLNSVDAYLKLYVRLSRVADEFKSKFLALEDQVTE